MIFTTHSLEGKIKKDIDTEIRFICASARADSSELVYCFTSDAQNVKSRFSAIRSVLGAMKREGLIQFYVSSDSMKQRTVESDFLNNKYSGILSEVKEDESGFFVKI